MSYTNATVIIAAEYQADAQKDFPGSFSSAFYTANQGANPFVATDFICSGLWADSDLSKVTNDVAWQRKVYFGEVQSILDSLNLKPVETSQVQES